MTAFAPPLPLGHTINGSPHSVLLQLPTLADVIGYEEKHPGTMAAIRSGYPRFVTPPFCQQVRQILAERLKVAPEQVFPVAGPAAAVHLTDYVQTPAFELIEAGGIQALVLPPLPEVLLATRRYLQHTGCGLGSRSAEAWLVGQRLIAAPFTEERWVGANPWAEVRRSIAPWLGVSSPDQVLLQPSGMAAFAAALHAAHTVQTRICGRPERHRWLQLGWLYLDTMKVLEARARGGPEPLRHFQVSDLESLRAILEVDGRRIAGIVTEAPTNPLLQTPPLAELRALCDAHGCLLIVDPSAASPVNVDVLRFADLVTVSLTKYCGHEGDVLMGAVAVNPHGARAAELTAQLATAEELVPESDVRRLAFQLPKMPAVVAQINRNAEAAAALLDGHPAIAQVWHSAMPSHRREWENVRRPAAGPGGLLSFAMAPSHSLARVYDRFPLPKSPSFGYRQTLLCPFLYLAHYDLVSTNEGRAHLRLHGLEPDLLRLAPGTEPTDVLLAALAEALA